MAQINFRLDDELKIEAEKVCAAMGLTMSAAINIFLTKVVKERRIPFEITADPFYAADNIKEQEQREADIRTGKSTLKVHEMIDKE